MQSAPVPHTSDPGRVHQDGRRQHRALSEAIRERPADDSSEPRRAQRDAEHPRLLRLGKPEIFSDRPLDEAEEHQVVKVERPPEEGEREQLKRKRARRTFVRRHARIHDFESFVARLAKLRKVRVFTSFD